MALPDKALLLNDGRINDIVFDAIYYPENCINILSNNWLRGHIGYAYNDVDIKIRDKASNAVAIYTYYHRSLPFVRHATSLKPFVEGVFAAITPMLAHRRLGHAG